VNEMSRLIDSGLQRLSDQITRMAKMSEEAVSLSLDSYMKGLNVHDKIQALSENLVFLSGVIEDQAIELIARYQPVASDLRVLKSYMKIGYDLSRCGRYAWDIAFIQDRLEMKNTEYMLPNVPLEDMVNTVLDMIGVCMQALQKRDAELAERLKAQEDRVDTTYVRILDQILRTNTVPVRHIVGNLLFIRHLERIADHVAYIGESVVYMVTGERASLR